MNIDINTLKNKIENISEKVHEAWAREKLSQGFHSPNSCQSDNHKSYLNTDWKNQDRLENVFNPKFFKWCDKCHTDLYSYSELPENKKEYDRVTVRAVLSAIEDIHQPYFQKGDRVRIKDAMDVSYIGKIGIVEEVSKYFPTSCKLMIDGKPGSWGNAWSVSMIEKVEDNSVEERLPVGTEIIDKQSGERLAIVNSTKTDNQFGYGVYLYDCSGLNTTLSLYRKEFILVSDEGV
ncbi:RyR domain protein [compost metagenome]